MISVSSSGRVGQGICVKANLEQRKPLEWFVFDILHKGVNTRLSTGIPWSNSCSNRGEASFIIHRSGLTQFLLKNLGIFRHKCTFVIFLVPQVPPHWQRGPAGGKHTELSVLVGENFDSRRPIPPFIFQNVRERLRSRLSRFRGNRASSGRFSLY